MMFNFKLFSCLLLLLVVTSEFIPQSVVSSSFIPENDFHWLFLFNLNKILLFLSGDITEIKKRSDDNCYYYPVVSYNVNVNIHIYLCTPSGATHPFTLSAMLAAMKWFIPCPRVSLCRELNP